MRRWINRAGMALALGLLILSFVNASWIAPKPDGALKLIAHRGVAQQFSREGIDDRTCTAKRIEKPTHDYIDNTLRSIEAAWRNSADWVHVDLRLTADDRLVLFHDEGLECRTNGRGKVRDTSLAQLRALDVGFGYSADGGNSFPLRGKGVGKMASLDDLLAEMPRRQFIFQFKDNDRAAADALLAAFAARNLAIDDRYGFSGNVKPLARIRQAVPNAWIWDKDQIASCAKNYAVQGWFGLVPGACTGGTMIVPLNLRWVIAGWPNRFLKRMNDAGTRVVIAGPRAEGQAMAGLTELSQLDDVPADFKGYLWIEDIATIGPAIRR